MHNLHHIRRNTDLMHQPDAPFSREGRDLTGFDDRCVTCDQGWEQVEEQQQIGIIPGCNQADDAMRFVDHLGTVQQVGEGN